MQRSFLKKQRLKRDITLEKLAKLLGISRQMINSIELGYRDPSFKVACKLEKFFGIAACELLKRDGEDDED